MFFFMSVIDHIETPFEIPTASDSIHYVTHLLSLCGIRAERHKTAVM